MRIFVLLTFISVLFSANGQENSSKEPHERNSNGVVKGKVIDENANTPIEYATVALKDLNDTLSDFKTGTITLSDGSFSVQGLSPSTYVLIVDFIGYKRFESKAFTLSESTGMTKEFGTINLLPSSQKLTEVEVLAEKPLMTNSIDKKVFNAEKNITTAGGTALEVLQNVPSVQVDQDGNVSLRGNSNVTVLIDGRPSGLTGGSRQALLEQIPASSIESIEVITNPSAKYDPDGMSGIINIILKKNKLKGTNGMVSLSLGNKAKLRGINKYNFNSNLSYRNEKWNLYANYSYNDRSNIRGGTVTRETITDSINYGLSQFTRSERDRFSHMLKIGVERKLNKKNSIALSSTINKNSRLNNEIIIYEDLIDEQLNLIRVRNNDENNGRNSVDLNLNYKHDFKGKGQTLIFDVNQSLSNGGEDGVYLEDYYNNDGSLQADDIIRQNNIEDNLNSITTAQIDFSYPFKKKFKFESGFKTIIRNIDNDFFSESYVDSLMAFSNDVNISNRFEYNELINAVYGIFAWEINKKWSTQGGLRAEMTDVNSKLINTGEEFPNPYNSLFPSAYLNYNFDEFTALNLSYSRRINRPSIRALNPFTDYSNPLLLRTGNPFLKPEYINSFELAYNKYFKNGITVTPSVYYKQTTDVIQRVILNDSVANRRIVKRDNIGLSQSWGLELVFSGKVTKKINVTISGNGFWNRTLGTVEEMDLNNDALGGNANLIVSYALNDKTSCQLTYSYTAPKLFAQGRIKARHGADIALKHKIWNDKADLGLRFTDVFNTRGFYIDVDNYDVAQDVYNKDYVAFKWESQVVFLSFTYRFGKLESGKQNKSRKKGSGNEGGFNAGDGGGL